MSAPFLNTITESVFLCMFIVNLYYIRKDLDKLKLMLSLLIYGTLVEMLTAPLVNAYVYGEFNLMFMGVPLWILTSWAVIIYSAIQISNSIFKNPLFLSLVDGLLALSVDLIMDPVSSSLGLWRWTYGGRDVFLGVPYGNFIGWFLVAATFSFMFRFFTVYRSHDRYIYVYSIIISSLVIFVFNLLKDIPMAPILSIISFYLIIFLSITLCSLRCEFREDFRFWDVSVYWSNLFVFYMYFFSLAVLLL